MKRLCKVDTKWSPLLVYALGIIATDGNLSGDGRHINITSKDKELILNIKSCLKLKNKIGRKGRGGSSDKKYFVLQFGDKNFYNFLLDINLTPAKSKTIGSLNIPNKYFFDFLRGCIDGDGNISVTYHPESKLPQLRIRLSSASLAFVKWNMKKIKYLTNINNGWIYRTKKGMNLLSYGKSDSIKILKLMYYRDVKYCLSRKYNMAKIFLGEW